MSTKTPTTEIQNAFTELTHRLGGIFHEHEVPDQAIWAISRAVDIAFSDSVLSVQPKRREKPAEHAQPHPALVSLLSSIDKHSKQ